MFRIWNKYWKKTTLSICCFWLWMCACRVILLQFCISTRLHQYIEKKWIYSIDYKQQVDERDFIFLINKFRFFSTKWFYLELIYFTWIDVIHSGKKKRKKKSFHTSASYNLMFMFLVKYYIRFGLPSILFGMFCSSNSYRLINSLFFFLKKINLNYKSVLAFWSNSSSTCVLLGFFILKNFMSFIIHA